MPLTQNETYQDRMRLDDILHNFRLEMAAAVYAEDPQKARDEAEARCDTRKAEADTQLDEMIEAAKAREQKGPTLRGGRLLTAAAVVALVIYLARGITGMTDDVAPVVGLLVFLGIAIPVIWGLGGFDTVGGPHIDVGDDVKPGGGRM